jgi:hypothetical protein
LAVLFEILYIPCLISVSTLSNYKVRLAF